MVNNYYRSKIYKIVCNITGKIYVGSTTEPTLARRLVGHKSHYNSYLTGKRGYITSIEILKNENYYIELICNINCTSKDELNAIEGNYIRNINCVNRCVAGRTQKQYEDEHAVEIKKYEKKYREEHAVESKQYREDHAVELKKYEKKYRVEHTVYFQQYSKKYREENNPTVVCKLCDRTVSTKKYLTHSKSKNCENYYNRKLDLIEKLKVLEEYEI